MRHLFPANFHRSPPWIHRRVPVCAGRLVLSLSTGSYTNIRRSGCFGSVLLLVLLLVVLLSNLCSRTCNILELEESKRREKEREREKKRDQERPSQTQRKACTTNHTTDHRTAGSWWTKRKKFSLCYKRVHQRVHQTAPTLAVSAYIRDL